MYWFYILKRILQNCDVPSLCQYTVCHVPNSKNGQAILFFNLKDVQLEILTIATDFFALTNDFLQKNEHFHMQRFKGLHQTDEQPSHCNVVHDFLLQDSDVTLASIYSGCEGMVCQVCQVTSTFCNSTILLAKNLKGKEKAFQNRGRKWSWKILWLAAAMTLIAF